MVRESCIDLKEGNCEKTMKTIKPKIIVFVFCLIVPITVTFFHASTAFAYSATVFWDAPTENADGTTLSDLEGYRVYYGTSSRNYSQSIDVRNVTAYIISDLVSEVTYYFAVTAYDTSGNESDFSNEVSLGQHVLTTTKGGTGNGTVTSAPAGIDCGSDCKESYKNGMVVTLTAIPDTGSLFTGWSGSGCAGNGQCAFTVNADTTVMANFDVANPMVILTSPNGGEIIPSGSTYPVGWEASLTATKFDLMYSMDNGETWLPVAYNVTDTNYNWQVPIPSGNKYGCLLKVTGYDSYGAKIGEDTSDLTFTVQVVSVISPKKEDILIAGSTWIVQWLTNMTTSPVAKTVLRYTCNDETDETNWNKIDELPGNPGSYLWTVPYVSSAQCKIRVVLIDADGNMVGRDANNKFFTIQP
jgi:Divergent InlB B-repeat domain/Fibronectin type III domain